MKVARTGKYIYTHYHKLLFLNFIKKMLFIDPQSKTEHWVALQKTSQSNRYTSLIYVNGIENGLKQMIESTFLWSTPGLILQFHDVEN